MGSKSQLLTFWRTLGLEEQLLQAFAEIPREQFVLPHLKRHAYDDHALPTMRKQSISQPTTVMIMLKALEIKKGDQVFELGAGVGYQAALLSRLVGGKGKVVSTEIIPELVQGARQNLDYLQLQNILILEADGSEGHPSEAPYDKIIITAACPAIPQPLIDQLKEGGIIIAPVGDFESQILVKGIKTKTGLDLEFLGQFAFVPLKGKYGFKEIDQFQR